MKCMQILTPAFEDLPDIECINEAKYFIFGKNPACDECISAYIERDEFTLEELQMIPIKNSIVFEDCGGFKFL